MDYDDDTVSFTLWYRNNSISCFGWHVMSSICYWVSALEFYRDQELVSIISLIDRLFSIRVGIALYRVCQEVKIMSSTGEVTEL